MLQTFERALALLQERRPDQKILGVFGGTSCSATSFHYGLRRMKTSKLMELEEGQSPKDLADLFDEEFGEPGEEWELLDVEPVRSS